MKSGKLYELKADTVRSVLYRINGNIATSNTIVFEHGDVIMAISQIMGSNWGICLYGDNLVTVWAEHFQEV